MKRSAMSKQDLQELTERLLNGTYRPLDPQEMAEEDTETVRTLNRIAGLLDSAPRRGEDQQLYAARTQLEQILREAPIGICITNERGYFDYVNPAYCRLYGYSPDELIGEHFTLVVPEEHREKMNELHERFMGRRYELFGEWTVQHRDGSLLTIFANAAYILDERDEPKKVTFVVDVTKRIYYERELKRTVTALKREIEERKRVAENRDRAERMLRHDMKNPLNGILGGAQLLQENCEREDDLELVGIIGDAGKRLNAMLEGLFDYTKMEDGRYRLSPCPIVLEDLLEAATAGMKTLLQRRSVRLSIFVDGVELHNRRAGSVSTFYGERAHLQTMLENLLRNAIEASPEEGTVTLQTEVGESLRFDLHNASVIPKEVRETFFQRYASARKQRGTGLGTYVAKLICELHGGEISFSTSEDEGTHLYLSLPIQPQGTCERNGDEEEKNERGR